MEEETCLPVSMLLRGAIARRNGAWGGVGLCCCSCSCHCSVDAAPVPTEGRAEELVEGVLPAGAELFPRG